MSAHARGSDPITSHDAAASITTEAIRRTQRIVLRGLRAIGPCHDQALVRHLQAEGKYVSESGIRTRRCELARVGLVVDTGEKVLTVGNRRSIVWAAAEEVAVRVPIILGQHTLFASASAESHDA